MIRDMDVLGLAEAAWRGLNPTPALSTGKRQAEQSQTDTLPHWTAQRDIQAPGVYAEVGADTGEGDMSYARVGREGWAL